MSAFSRGVRLAPVAIRWPAHAPKPSRPPRPPSPASTLAGGRRSFRDTASRQSGHNKWSKIRHSKGINDAKKNAVRSDLSRNITVAVKVYGPDPAFNHTLVAAIAAAKKANTPKDVIETAIARGQGKSAAGEALEAVTLECVLPGSVALIVEAETDKRKRLVSDIQFLFKGASGALSPAKYFFTRQGRVVLRRKEVVVDRYAKPAARDEADTGSKTTAELMELIMDDAIEAGAEDLSEGDHGTMVVWTQPSLTMQVAKALGPRFGLEVLEADMVWTPVKETMVALQPEEEQKTRLIELFQALRDYPEVHGVYSNVTQGTLSEAEFAAIQDCLDV